jgi:hypothetical protein
MDDEIRESREAAQRAADLDHLGPNVGAGATIWARAAQDALALQESARARFEASTPDLEVWERFHSSALVVVVAVEQVLAFARSVLSLTGDAELARARARFEARVPHVEAFRDLVAHLDDYAIGLGWSQRPTDDGTPPLITEKNLAVQPFWTDVDGMSIDLAGMRVDLAASVEAATELAQVVERAREKGLTRASNDANDAMKRRFERHVRRVSEGEGDEGGDGGRE